MTIKFTQHALSQMKIRGIGFDEVQMCLQNPEKMEPDGYGNTVAQKIMHPNLLRVIFREEGKDLLVITAYRTSKVNKYQ